jgi:uncharacterized protein YgiB involved in biofilm formation
VDCKGEKDNGDLNQKPKEKRVVGGDKKSKWGPVVAGRRSSRIMNDGRSTLEKAQEIRKKVDLEANYEKSKK